MPSLKGLFRLPRRKKQEPVPTSNQAQKFGPDPKNEAVQTTISKLAEPHAQTSARNITEGSNFGLKMVHEPPALSEPGFDIIFVHGLTGNAYRTWLHKESQVHWPSELLRHDLPDARVMVWGYDANVSSFWGHAAQNRLGEHAKNLMGDLTRHREDTNTVCCSSLSYSLWFRLRKF
jgi:hypothetical protein